MSNKNDKDFIKFIILWIVLYLVFCALIMMLFDRTLTEEYHRLAGGEPLSFDKYIL